MYRYSGSNRDYIYPGQGRSYTNPTYPSQEIVGSFPSDIRLPRVQAASSETSDRRNPFYDDLYRGENRNIGTPYEKPRSKVGTNGSKGRGSQGDPPLTQYRWWGYLVTPKYRTLPEKQLTNRSLLRGFTEYSTSHGFPNIVRSTGLIKKLLWILITLAALVGFFYNSYDIVSNYIAFDTTTSISIITKRELKFPAVTICNLNAVRRSVINQPKYAFLLNSLNITGAYGGGNNEGQGKGQPNQGGQGGTAREEHNAERGLGKQSDEQKITDSLMEQIASLPKSVKKELGHQKKDFIIGCTYDGYACNVSDFRWSYNAALGSCYTFNGPGAGSHLTSTHAGVQYGLKLILNIEQDEYTHSVSNAAGARVLIHPQLDYPFPENNGLVVGPGVLTSFGIRQVSISRLGGVYSNCVNVSNNRSSYDVYQERYPHIQYSTRSCLKTCIQRELISRCNCTDPSVPRKGKALNIASNISPCSVQNDVEINCKFEVTQLWKTNQIVCDCPDPCSSTHFKSTQSDTVWPADKALESVLATLSAKSKSLNDLIKHNPKDPHKYKRNLLQAEIFYEELNYEAMVDTAAYSEGQFLSDFGGCVGLWIGASLISVIEILELLSDLMVLWASKLCCTTRKPPAPSY